MDAVFEFLSKPIVGLAISIVATWLFAWRYYKKAGDELKVETENLRKLNEKFLVEADRLRTLSEHLLLVVTHPPGTYTVRIENGKIVGMYGNMSVKM